MLSFCIKADTPSKHGKETGEYNIKPDASSECQGGKGIAKDEG
jgi:hypothetical protein